MSDKATVKTAARRMETQRRRDAETPLFIHLWNVLCRKCRKIWNWARGVDWAGIINIVLLIAIITIFTYLLLDIIHTHRLSKSVTVNNVPVVAAPGQVKKTVHVNKHVRATATPAPITRETILPIRRDKKTKRYVQRPINVAKCTHCSVSDSQIAAQKQKMYGDIVVDNSCTGKMVRDGTAIHGNLYLQGMRKYTLPCNIHIDGNLFLRDVHLLQFCGDFVITGNIYVGPRSSFGPIPTTATLGGQIIL